MKCTQSEKLIPLFAGDDLPAREAGPLRQHLESCASCRQLVSEFEESRDWLINLAAPRFDEAILDDLRNSVLQEIGQGETRQGLLEWISPRWNTRFVFAASLAALLLTAAFGLLAYRPQPPHDPKQDQAQEKKGAGNQAQSHPDEARNESGPQIVNKQPERRGITYKAIRPGLTESPQPEAQTIEPDFVASTAEPAEPPPDSTKTDLATNREMTRIEFQTADPNIRIIWFAPKTDASQISRP